jgi:putative ABC transport system substrate-binding protein
MNRRDTVFGLFALGGGLMVYAAAIRAEPSANRKYRVGCVWIATQKLVQPYEDSVIAGLHDHGYDVGRNLVFEARYADGDARRLPALIDELMLLQPDVLLGIGQSAALMKAKTSRIPIVVTLALDPVESGLAKSLSRPGGNVTGIATLYEELVAKQIEILGELVPKLSNIALLSDASDPAAPRYTEYAQRGARLKRANLVSIPVRDQAGVEAAFA